MSLRQLSALMIAVAMLFAPIGIFSGAAMAMAPASDHHPQMTESGHCEERPIKDGSGKSDDKSSCAAMCMAIAIAPTTPTEPLDPTISTERPALIQFRHSFLAELPTPPPRHA